MRESKCKYIVRRDFSALFYLVLFSQLPIYSSYLLLMFKPNCTFIQSWKDSKAQQSENKSALEGEVQSDECAH